MNKFKKIPKEYFSTIIDRLTRFSPAYIKYKRVFDDIIDKFSLDKKNKDFLNLDEKISYVEEIFNCSIVQNDDYYINDILIDLEKRYFNPNEISYQYLSSRVNISGMLNEIQFKENMPINLKWILSLNKNKNLNQNRIENSLLYPIEKIILCEGQTEYTLLNTIFKLFGYDFNKHGIYIIPAGGKSQVARKYYEMLEYTKLPIFILLDNDAKEIKNLITLKLRNIDKLYLINCGEFEDLIPNEILKNTINYNHCNELNCSDGDFMSDCANTKNIEFIYKKYGYGEYKKAHFANNLKDFIESNCTKEDFKNSEISNLIFEFIN